MTSKKKLPSIKQRQISAINDELALLRGNLEVLEKAGLRKSGQAKELVKRINGKVLDRELLVREDQKERRDCVQHLLLAISAADFACEACNRLSEKLKKTYGTLLPEQKDLIGLLDGLGRDFGGLVLIIDKACDEYFSINFAKMSDELMDTMTQRNLDKALEIIRKHDDAGNGNNIRIR